MIKKSLFIICLFFWLTFSANAQTVFDYTPECKEAYSLLFDLRFTEAQKILDNEKKINPSNGIPIYLEHYMLFLKRTSYSASKPRTRLGNDRDAFWKFNASPPTR